MPLGHQCLHWLLGTSLLFAPVRVPLEEVPWYARTLVSRRCVFVVRSRGTRTVITTPPCGDDCLRAPGTPRPSLATWYAPSIRARAHRSVPLEVPWYARTPPSVFKHPSASDSLCVRLLRPRAPPPLLHYSLFVVPPLVMTGCVPLGHQGLRWLQTIPSLFAAPLCR